VRTAFQKQRVTGTKTARDLLLLLVVLAATVKDASAETTHDLRLWTNLTVQGPFSKHSRWRWYFDVQQRDRNRVRDVDQFVVRPAAGFTVTDRSSVWAGYAYTANFTSHGTFGEHRLWQQYLWSCQCSQANASSRTRIEQRVFSGAESTQWRVRSQLSYMGKAKKSRVMPLVWDEVMFRLNTTSQRPRGFDQNRAFTGVGVKLNSGARIEVGYMNQFRRSGQMNHVLSTVMNVNL